MAIPTTPTDTLDSTTDQGVPSEATSTTTGEPTMNELTVYDATLNCHVLNPKAFPNIINAFHPDYVKTYMPELLSTIKTEARMKENGEKVAKTTPMKMHIIRPAHVHRPKLAPTDFHVYQKAGMPKGVKK
jgi:hypothetical protein